MTLLDGVHTVHDDPFTPFTVVFSSTEYQIKLNDCFSIGCEERSHLAFTAVHAFTPFTISTGLSEMGFISR